MGPDGAIFIVCIIIEVFLLSLSVYFVSFNSIALFICVDLHESRNSAEFLSVSLIPIEVLIVFIIIIMVIFKRYFSGVHIALLLKKRCEH